MHLALSLTTCCIFIWRHSWWFTDAFSLCSCRDEEWIIIFSVLFCQTFNAQNEFLRKSPSHWHSAVSPIVTAVRCNICFSLKEMLGNYFGSLQRGTEKSRLSAIDPQGRFWMDCWVGPRWTPGDLTESLMEIFTLFKVYSAPGHWRANLPVWKILNSGAELKYLVILLHHEMKTKL